jgi:hypothetical protein
MPHETNLPVKVAVRSTDPHKEALRFNGNNFSGATMFHISSECLFHSNIHSSPLPYLNLSSLKLSA